MRMLARVLVPASLMAASGSGATSYHIAQGGLDSRTAQDAASEATPWGSFAPLANLALQAGDSILLHRGDTLRGTLRLARSGTAASPIAIAPYGSGTARPVVSGAEPIAGWTRVSGDHWSAKIPGGSVSRLMETGVPLACARWPDTGYVASTAFDGDSVMTIPVGPGDWTGATALIRTEHWTLEEHKILAQSGNRLSLDRSFVNSPAAGMKAFLVNHPSALTRPETWASSAYPFPAKAIPCRLPR